MNFSIHFNEVLWEFDMYARTKETLTTLQMIKKRGPGWRIEEAVGSLLASLILDLWCRLSQWYFLSAVNDRTMEALIICRNKSSIIQIGWAYLKFKSIMQSNPFDIFQTQFNGHFLHNKINFSREIWYASQKKISKEAYIFLSINVCKVIE